MLEFFLTASFIGSSLTLAVGAAFILFIRKKTKSKAEASAPVGFWARALCLGTDLAIIDILNLFIAYHGSLRAAGYISSLITVSYFFFFWLFFSTTPASVFARIKIISKDGGSLKVWQVLARLGMCVFLFIGWIPMVFDKKEKKAWHDIIAHTRVVYTTEPAAPHAKEGLVKKLQFAALGFVVVLFVSFAAFGSGEDIRKYAETEQIQFFDLDHDKAPDGLSIDMDKDGKPDIFKYDLDNDHLVDFTTFDTDKDGIAESIDLNNDGRIDGFDFNNDNKLDIPVFAGQLVIWLWRVWFGVLAVGLTGGLVFTVLKERRQ